MAIKWKSKFIKKPTGHYSAIFDRYDDAEPDVMLGTVNIGDAILDTVEQEKALWNLVWSQYKKNKPIVDSKITDLESTAKSNLESKEK